MEAHAKKRRGRPPKGEGSQAMARDDSPLDRSGIHDQRSRRARPPKGSYSRAVLEGTQSLPQENEDDEDSFTRPARPQPEKKRQGPGAKSKQPLARIALADDDDDSNDDEMQPEVEAPVSPQRRRGKAQRLDTADMDGIPERKKSSKGSVKASRVETFASTTQRKQVHKAPQATVTARGEEESSIDEDSLEQSMEAAEVDEEMEVEEDADDGDSDAEEPLPAPSKRGHKASSTARGDAGANRNAPKRKRAESISSVEDEENSKPALRRRLGHITKQMETLRARYEKLQEVGIKEAEVNFDNLMKKQKAQEKASHDLIKALKGDLADARKELTEATKLQSKLEKAEERWRESQKGLDNLKERARVAEAESKSASSKLAAAESESKTLRTKLAAARQAAAEASASNGRIPGSAAKGKGKATVDSYSAAQVAIATLKEDLYSDLTGLIVRDVDRADEGDVFDCIQTGRNGTLHFLLAIDKSDPSASYEETEFHYKPLIDEQRDEELLEILPEYLGGEIDFPRASATKFFSRIWDPLTRKLA